MKSMIKRIIVGVCIGLVLMFIKSCDVHAYVVVSNGAGWTSIPNGTSAIVSPLNTWPNSGYVFSPSQDAWITSIGQYWYATNMNGRYLKVNADFYYGIETSYNVGIPTNYLNTTRNPITANNLRCGIGNTIGSGYDSTYSPKVSNFSATYSHDLSANNYPHTVYHITFTYEQQLGSDMTGNSNMSCWFVSSGTQLLVQLHGSVAQQLMFQYTPTLQWSLTQDQTNSQLNTITEQNKTIINQNQTQINQNNQIIQEEKNTQNKIEDNTKAQKETNDLLKDTNTPSNNDVNSLTDSIQFEESNVPELFQIFPKITGAISTGVANGCSTGFDLGELYGNVIIIPCINPGQYLGTYIWGVCDAIFCMVFLYYFIKWLVNLYQKFTSLREVSFE